MGVDALTKEAEGVGAVVAERVEDDVGVVLILQLWPRSYDLGCR